MLFDSFLLQLRLTKVNEQLESEKREFAILLEKRNREIDSLNGKLYKTLLLYFVIIYT